MPRTVPRCARCGAKQFEQFKPFLFRLGVVWTFFNRSGHSGLGTRLDGKFVRDTLCALVHEYVYF